MATTMDFADVDGWIQHLMQCKQLPEADVKRLCDKVFLSKIAVEMVATYPVKRPFSYTTTQRSGFFFVNSFLAHVLHRHAKYLWKSQMYSLSVVL